MVHVPLDCGDIGQKNGLLFEILGWIITDSIVRGVPMNSYIVEGLLGVRFESRRYNISEIFTIVVKRDISTSSTHCDF